ncbi:MAG: DNA translocase FtsK 4TM domain-containing protein [Solirubrobacterales bacterium]
MASKPKRQKAVKTSKTAAVSAPAKSAPPAIPKNRIELHAALVITLGLFLLGSFIYTSGQPDDRQLIGIAGTYFVKGMTLLFGQNALLLPTMLFIWGWQMLAARRYLTPRMTGFLLLSGAILLYSCLFSIPGGLTVMEAAQQRLGGGYVGAVPAFILLALLGRMGTTLVMVLLVLIGGLMLINKPLMELLQLAWQGIKQFFAALEEMVFIEEPEEERPDPIIVSTPQPARFQGEPLVLEPQVVTEAKPAAPEPELAVPKSVKPKRRTGEGTYTPPPLDLIAASDTDRGHSKSDIKESIKKLEDTFNNFGIKIKVNQVSCGPTVTRYELQPAPGVKVSKIISLTDDLQLSLAAKGIRIEAPIPGKSAVGIEVPNDKSSKVGLRTILASPVFRESEHPLTVALGEDIGGNVVVAKLADMPHLLVAGSTGSGKSVCLNSLILSLIYKASPKDLRLILIDPKMVELTIYNGIPHLLSPVVTDAKKAAYVLRWMITEMEKRYRRFADEGVRDIYRYNEIAADRLPFIVIIIDELADLMMVSPVDVEDSICRLAQMARAAGIHLVVATQRPSVDVVTGLIKANIPSRIAFAVSSQVDSRTILDGSGAEKLLGRGDMLFFPVGASKPHRVQGAFVSDGEIERVVEYLKEMANEEPEQQTELEMPPEPENSDVDDELFWDAVQVFVETQKASVSLLQRKLKVGYARAARLVDIMEDRGMISTADGNKRREILIDEAQLERLSSRGQL